MDNQKRSEWIDQYLLGELKDGELDQFQQQLQTDANFKQEVEVQKTIFLQARKVGRDAMRQQLKELHQRPDLRLPGDNILRSKKKAMKLKTIVPPALNPKRTRIYQYYALAASIALLLVVSFLVYFLYPTAPANNMAQRNNATAKESIRPQLFIIRLEKSGDTRNFGFGGTDEKDTTVAVLIYPAEKGSKSYQFNDTLRLYGRFVPERFSLQYIQNTGQYMLREGSVLYPLQRYHPQQALKPAL